MQENETPYILSEDIYLLMKRWSLRSAMRIPSRSYFLNITIEIKKNLNYIFKNVVILESRNIIEFARGNIEKNCSLASMDRAYASSIKSDKLIQYLDSCRAFNTNGDSIKGERPERQLIENQLQNKNVVLFDDVIFDGDSVIETYNQIKEKFNVRKIVVGFATKTGKKKAENNTGLIVQAAYEFGEILDEVCERDFIPGSPLCGRPVFFQGKQNIFLGSKPYLSPFGDVVKWASIPEESSNRFSCNCMQITLNLWKEVEMLNKTKLRNRDLPRAIYGLSYDAPIVETLSNLNFNRS